MAVKVWFWLLWSIDAIVAAVVLYFFVWGLSDGTVSSFNILIWFALVGAVAAVVGGSLWLRAAGRPTIGIGILLILAFPSLLLGFFFLVLIIAHPRWN
jgi:hypothetical protein